MTHATAEQVHDHAFGFRRSAHIESCADCGRAAAVVAGEIDALRDVLNAPPSARARIGPAGLAAAALLLVALSWLLFQPADRPAPAAPLPSQESDVARLIGELNSKSPLRQEIARHALKTYCGTAVEALVRAKVDPVFIDEVRAVTETDRALMRKLKAAPLTMEHERVLYTDVLYELEATTGRVETDFNTGGIETAFIKISVRNGTVHDAIEQLCAGLRQPWRSRHGALVIGKRALDPAFAPLRIHPSGADPAPFIADLGSDVPARRDAASAALRKLGFAAEPVLWGALEAESPETRNRAAALLKDLYVHPTYDRLTPAAKQALPKITIQRQDQPLLTVVADILTEAGPEYSVVRETRVNLPKSAVTLLVRDIPFDGALNLLIQPYGFSSIAMEGCVFAREFGRASAWTPPLHVLWTTAAKARAIEPLIEGLASSEPARRDEALRGLWKLPPEDALEGLAAADGVLQGEALTACRRVRREIAGKNQIWIQDLPSGAELQSLTPAQKAILETVVAPSEEELSFEQIFKRAGVRCVFRHPVEEAMRIQGKGPKLSTLLKLVLRSRGWDFYLDGESVVIDLAPQVRAAVEK